MANTDVCSPAEILLFPCSGAADVGLLSDKTARELTAEGVCKMFCTAGIGGKVKPVLEAAAKAKKIIALDGCPLDCVKLSLEDAGFSDYFHIRVTDLGMSKGNTEINAENIAAVKDTVIQVIG